MNFPQLRKTRVSIPVFIVLSTGLALCQAPIVAISSTDGISHSTVRLNYTWQNGPLTASEIIYSLAPANCSTGSPQPATVPNYYSPWSMVLAGLQPATTYNVCVRLSNGSGTTISSPVSVTTDPLPSVHPASPTPPDSFDSDYPDTNGYVKVMVSSDCSDLQSAINDAVSQQATHGTILSIPAGAVCTLPRLNFNVYAPDAIGFNPSSVRPGSPGQIVIPGHGLTEGQLLTFGSKYEATNAFPTSSSCAFHNGLVPGSKYYAHVVNPDTIAVYCSDGKTLLSFSDQGSGVNGFLLVPHFKATGHCPSTSGETVCSYWRRKLNWIIIRAGAADNQLPPEHTRITPGWCSAGRCATLVNPVANVGSTVFIQHGDSDGNFQTMVGNIHWGPGIEFTNAIDPDNGIYSNMINTAAWNSDIVLDRVYLHGGGTPQRWGSLGLPAWSWNGLNFAFKDSYVDNETDWEDVAHDGSSGILSRGPGPTTIVNNYFEGAGILLHFDEGGGTTYIRGDNSVIRNTFKAPRRYMYGSPDSDGHMYGQRQPLEFKSGIRDLIAGNIFDTTWNEITGASVFVALTSVSGVGISDVDLSNNTFMHGPGVANVPLIVAGGAPQTLPPNRFRFHNNLAFDINSNWWVPQGGALSPSGWLFEGPEGGEDIVIDHNTFMPDGGRVPAVFFLFDTAVEGVQVTNNIFKLQAGHGINVDGQASHPCTNFADAALWSCAMANNSLWANNLLVPSNGDVASLQAAFHGMANYYTTNYTNMPASVMTGAITGRSAYLLSQICEFCGSPTTNGQAVGVSLNELQSSQGYVTLVGIGSDSSAATINFVAPDSQACPIDYSSVDPNVMSNTTRVKDIGGARVRTIGVGQLASKTTYYFRINCAVQQPMGKFQTK